MNVFRTFNGNKLFRMWFKLTEGYKMSTSMRIHPLGSMNMFNNFMEICVLDVHVLQAIYCAVINER